MVKPPTRELGSSKFALRKMLGDGTSIRLFFSLILNDAIGILSVRLSHRQRL